jgi:hypothetical protein
VLQYSPVLYPYALADVHLNTIRIQTIWWKYQAARYFILKAWLSGHGVVGFGTGFHSPWTQKRHHSPNITRTNQIFCLVSTPHRFVSVSAPVHPQPREKSAMRASRLMQVDVDIWTTSFLSPVPASKSSRGWNRNAGLLPFPTPLWTWLGICFADERPTRKPLVIGWREDTPLMHGCIPSPVQYYSSTTPYGRTPNMRVGNRNEPQYTTVAHVVEMILCLRKWRARGFSVVSSQYCCPARVALDYHV